MPALAATENIPVTSVSWQGREHGVLGAGTWTRHAKGDFGTCARLQEFLASSRETSTALKGWHLCHSLWGKHATCWWWHTRGVTSWCKNEDPPGHCSSAVCLREVPSGKSTEGTSVLLSDEFLFSFPFSWSTVALPLLMLCLFLLQMIYFLKEAKKSKANTEKWNVKAERKFIVKKTKLQGKGDPILQARPSQPCNPGVGDTDKWKPCLLLASVVAHSRMPDSVTPWTAACQASWLSPRVCSNLCPLSRWCNPTRPLSARYFF